MCDVLIQIHESCIRDIPHVHKCSEFAVYLREIPHVYAVYLARFGGLAELTWAMKNGDQNVKVEAAGVSLCIFVCVSL